MTAGNDVFKAILADTSPFIVKGGWFPSTGTIPPPPPPVWACSRMLTETIC